jgi:hypothetical protein
VDLPELGKQKIRPPPHRTTTTSELSTKTTQLTTFSPRFSHPISISIVVQLPKIRPDKPKQSRE